MLDKKEDVISVSPNDRIKDKDNTCLDNEDVDVGPFLTYLESEKGHELASRTLKIIEDIKKSTLENKVSHAKFEKWVQFGIIMIVVLASSILTYIGKFDSTIAVLFGTMVGYLFGRK